MARHDVYADPAGDLLLDCQADVLSHFDTRIVVPLLPAEKTVQASRLHPIFTIEGRKMVMVTQLASAVPVRILVNKVASLDQQHDTIMNAFDMLLTGY